MEVWAVLVWFITSLVQHTFNPFHWTYSAQVWCVSVFLVGAIIGALSGITGE